VESGKLRHQVLVEKFSTGTVGSQGGLPKSYTVHTTSRASVEPLRGNELVAAQQKYGDVDKKVRLRHVWGLTQDMRILVPAAHATVGKAITTSGVTTLESTDLTTFPPRGKFRVLTNAELMEVTAVASSYLTVTRAMDGTSPTSHSTDDHIRVMTVNEIVTVIDPGERYHEQEVYVKERA